MSDQNTATNPNASHEIPERAIHTAQDCISFGTVAFDLDEIVNQGGKRSVSGNCVLTGREFEVVWLHRNPNISDHHLHSDVPLQEYTFDRVWQIAPQKNCDVRLQGQYRRLRDTTAAIWNTEDNTRIGPLNQSD